MANQMKRMNNHSIGILVVSLASLFAVPAYSQDASFERFGSGCAGSAGLPSLDAAEDSLPRIGETFAAQFSNLPASASPFGLIGLVGLSNTHWAGVPLPFDLSPLGVTGCTLYVSVLRANPLFVDGGSGSAGWTLHVDNEPALLGVQFYMQGLVVDPSANAAGFVLSNAAEGVIGFNAGPKATIIFPTKVSATDARSIIVRGTASDPSGVAEVRVNGLLAASGDGFANWQVQVPLERGVTALVVSTRDGLGVGDAEAARARIESRLSRFSPTEIAIDADRNRALVYDEGSRAILAIDITTGTRVGFSDIDRGSGPEWVRPVAIEMDPSHDRALVADQGLGAILTLNLLTGDREIISDANTGTGCQLGFLQGLAVDGDYAFAVSGFPGGGIVGELIKVDLVTGDRELLASTSPIGNQIRAIWSGPVDIVIDDGRAFILDVAFDFHRGQFVNRLLVMNLATGEQSWLAGGGGRLALIGSLLLVAGSGSAGIRAVDQITGSSALVSRSSQSAYPYIPSRGSGPSFQNLVGIAVQGSTIFVADRDAGAITEVEFTSGDRRHLWKSGLGDGIDLRNPVGIIADGDRLLTFDVGLKAMVAVDLATGNRQIVSDEATGTGTGFNAVLEMIRVGDRALIANQSSIATLQWVDLVTGDRSVLSDSQHGMGPIISSADGIALDGSRVLVSSKDDWSVFSVDLVTGDRTVVSGTSSRSGVLIQPRAIVTDGARAIVINQRGDAIVAVDLQNGDRTTISLDIADQISAESSLALYDSELLIESKDRLLVMNLETGAYRVMSGLDDEVPAGVRGLGPIPSIEGLVVEGSIAYVADSGHFGAIMAIDLLTGERVILSQ